ncbi:MAG TPA: glucoamylase family protein [Candidatus Omnitrophota bacterium]|nr:glucoamylase family protein [Candidatus Omnitrophota bacterium]
MEKQYLFKKGSCLLGIGLILMQASCSVPRNDSVSDSGVRSQETVSSASKNPATSQPDGLAAEKSMGGKVSQPSSSAQLRSRMVADFEGDQEKMVNHLGGESGDWNWNPADINNSFSDLHVVKMTGMDGKETHVLSLTYSVDSDLPARNGFWTKLLGLDASAYDHLEFEMKGDAEKGFTKRFRLEMKKCVDAKCIEKVTGSATVPVTGEWKTVSIPLNVMTGLIDFSNPESWKNPRLGYKSLDEMVIILADQFVTKKTGRIYIDNIRFVRTGDPGPSAVDVPPRNLSKTTIPHGTLEFAKFLSKRLRGFPKTTVVKKEFSQDEKTFLTEVARDTWRFFDEIIDAESHLPLDNIQLGEKEPLGEGAWIGDYTNVTNIGVYLMVLVSAYDMGFITREEAIQRIRATLNTVEYKLAYHASGFPYNYYDTTLLDNTSYFVSFVDSGWLLLGLYVVKQAFPAELTDQTARLLKRGDLSFFYDAIEKQMYHGYYDNLKVYTDYRYGVFYTEPRVVSYLAVARGEVPELHWFEGLSRTFPENYTWQTQTPKNRIQRKLLGYNYACGYYEWKELKYVPSWGGSAFEALMPTVVLMEKELAPEGLGKNNAAHVQGQIRYAKEELGMPVWGMSPASVPEGGYSEFGAKPFGVKGYKSGVVTPHASVLALEYAPTEVVDNLRKLIELYPIYGEYGFYDAVTVATGKVAYKYLALDQGMIFVAINNYLNQGAIRNRFHAEPDMQKGDNLLTAEKFFEESPALTHAVSKT